MSNLVFGSVPLEQIEVGMSVSYSQTISDADIKSFAGLSGDHNPVHVSDTYARETRYGKRIAHGLMPAGFFSALFGTRLPGPGCVYVSQELKFKRPIYIDNTVTACVEVTGIDQERRRIWFDTICTVDGKIVITGKAEIYVPE